MKVFGIVLLVAGAIIFLIGFNLDTSVATSHGERVHNIGLMNDKQNKIIFAGVLAVIGAIFVGFGSKSKESRTANTGGRTCPFCAETIKEEATICRFCKKKLPPIPAKEEAPLIPIPVAVFYAHDPGNTTSSDSDLAFCFHCGESIQSGAKRCSSCGGILD